MQLWLEEIKCSSFVTDTSRVIAHEGEIHRSEVLRNSSTRWHKLLSFANVIDLIGIDRSAVSVGSFCSSEEWDSKAPKAKYVIADRDGYKPDNAEIVDDGEVFEVHV